MMELGFHGVCFDEAAADDDAQPAPEAPTDMEPTRVASEADNHLIDSIRDDPEAPVSYTHLTLPTTPYV